MWNYEPGQRVNLCNNTYEMLLYLIYPTRLTAYILETLYSFFQGCYFSIFRGTQPLKFPTGASPLISFRAPPSRFFQGRQFSLLLRYPFKKRKIRDYFFFSIPFRCAPSIFEGRPLSVLFAVWQIYFMGIFYSLLLSLRASTFSVGTPRSDSLFKGRPLYFFQGCPHDRCFQKRPVVLFSVYFYQGPLKFLLMHPLEKLAEGCYFLFLLWAVRSI